MYNSEDYIIKSDFYYRFNRSEMIKYIPENAKLILDVGCSEGNFGKLLKEKRACTVWGVEPDVKSASIAMKNIDRVFNTIFDENIDLENAKIDCIVFNDVLEHIINPNRVIQICKKYLAKGGVIVSSIPNIRYYEIIRQILFEKDWRYTEAGILDKTHLRFFTSKSIIKLFENEGYKIITHEGINTSYTRWFKILNIISFKWLDDMKHPQFATVVKINE